MNYIDIDYSQYDPGSWADQARDKYGMTEEQAAAKAGCWIAGHHGRYAIGELVRIAIDYGFTVSEDEQSTLDTYMDGGETGLGDDLAMVVEMADHAEEWLNDVVAPNGWAFGWDDGEFFLGRLPEDEDEEGEQRSVTEQLPPNTIEARAFNGHLLIYNVIGTYPDGRKLKTSQWDAIHSPRCHCGGREALPDW